MPSEHYNKSVEAGKIFQASNKAWGGRDTFKYHKQIKDVLTLHECKSVLDYGSGRGVQWNLEHRFPFQTKDMLFREYLGLTDVTLYDPCVPIYENAPPDGTKFDAVIFTQVLGSIPDDDISWVKEKLMAYTGKCCFIGLVDPRIPPKSRKQIYDPAAFRAARTAEWYVDQFKDWTGSKLYWWFRIEDTPYTLGWHEKTVAQIIAKE